MPRRARRFGWVNGEARFQMALQTVESRPKHLGCVRAFRLESLLEGWGPSMSLGRFGRRDKPVASRMETWLTVGAAAPSSFLPTIEIDGSGQRGEHDELGEGYVRFFGERACGFEGVRLVGRQTEDEGTRM